MKKILVLTDFTDQSGQITEAAVKLSGKLHANLILLNAFVSQPALSEYGTNPWSAEELLWADESKRKLALLKEDMEPLIAALPTADYRASIDCRQGMGSLGSQVKDMLKNDTIELVVMGARTGSAWDHLLMGSDTVSVINHTDRPVMIIPAGHPLKSLKKVTIATDFDEADLNAVHYLTRLGRLFNFTIEITHVKLWGEEGGGEAQQAAFAKHVAKFNYDGIAYQNISGKDLVNRLNKLVEENGSDLLVLVHDKHSLLDRLINGSNAKSLLEKQEFPVMIIPAGIVVK
ncbi:universal stress protein [Mucilaginibacter sp. UR6-11]|uniref:universal stress protein n=1 Tax=Mucilaginibacter sp. UR6-11 TaxID=1435644 RepID=UPI001E5CA2B9|nr:universal stress protein [Mucilaginibacter sp. UR6-11]MCC8425511.1 universal stress protein [Mucilaginibacter sp. UR6-11]